MLNLKNQIMNALKIQRADLLSLKLSDFDSVQECQNWFVNKVLNENDVLEQALETIKLNIDDINPDCFRDYQHDTIDICTFYFWQMQGGVKNEIRN